MTMRASNSKNIVDSENPSLTPELVIRRVRVCLPNLDLRLDQPLSRQNIDSIDFVDLLCTINAEFGVRLTEAELADDPTFIKLAESIAARAQNRSMKMR
jgi:acyl carrier protein